MLIIVDSSSLFYEKWVIGLPMPSNYDLATSLWLEVLATWYWLPLNSAVDPAIVQRILKTNDNWYSWHFYLFQIFINLLFGELSLYVDPRHFHYILFNSALALDTLPDKQIIFNKIVFAIVSDLYRNAHLIQSYVWIESKRRRFTEEKTCKSIIEQQLCFD